MAGSECGPGSPVLTCRGGRVFLCRIPRALLHCSHSKGRGLRQQNPNIKLNQEVEVIGTICWALETLVSSCKGLWTWTNPFSSLSVLPLKSQGREKGGELSEEKASVHPWEAKERKTNEVLYVWWDDVGRSHQSFSDLLGIYIHLSIKLYISGCPGWSWFWNCKWWINMCIFNVYVHVLSKFCFLKFKVYYKVCFKGFVFIFHKNNS